MGSRRDGKGVFALATGGGKDATLALHRVRRTGLQVPLAFTMHHRESGRVRLHGVPEELLRVQARALGMELMTGSAGDGDYEAIYGDLLDRMVERGMDGVVYGNIHLADVRAWYEERTRKRGFQHREPLWGQEPGALVREFIEAGYRATVTGVNLESGNAEWLGREVDLEFVGEVEATGADPGGERGEYHTFVWDGPEFRDTVPFRADSYTEVMGHRVLALALSE